MQKRLSELKPGEKAVILKIEDQTILRKRLRELGIREGKEIFMRRDAPMGDPLEISVMGFNISIRRSEAAFVLIERIEDLKEAVS